MRWLTRIFILCVHDCSWIYTCSCIYTCVRVFFQEYVDVSWKFMERVDCRCNVFQYCLKFGSRQDAWGRHFFVKVQAITWGTTEEAAHAVASLENILWLGKQFAVAAQHILVAVLCGVLITSHFQRDVLPGEIYLSGSNRFELSPLCCRWLPKSWKMFLLEDFWRHPLALRGCWNCAAAGVASLGWIDGHTMQGSWISHDFNLVHTKYCTILVGACTWPEEWHNQALIELSCMLRMQKYVITVITQHVFSSFFF